MRIVREQMLCIISPNWPDDVKPFQSNGLSGQLDQLFMDVGVVHFASVALLPPQPGMAAETDSSLMLEIAVDEGIRPQELLARLAHHPSGALWDIYGAYLKVQSPPSVGARNEWVLKQLLAGLSVADGGFVGPRDRTVLQVRGERELYERIRTQASATPAHLKSDRTSFALSLARWAYQEPRLETLSQSAPRSFWRRRGGAAKLSYFGLIIGLGLASLWLIRCASGVLSGWWEHVAVPLWLDMIVGTSLYWVNTLSTLALQSSLRLLIVLALAALAYGFVFMLLPSIFRPWRRWINAVGRELDRPTDTWSSRATCVFGWLVLAALGAALVAALAFVICGIEPLRDAFTWLRYGPDWLVWLIRTYAALFSTLLLVLALGLTNSYADAEDTGTKGWLATHLKKLQRRFYRPTERETPGAQQVHESIERCEAELVTGTAHIVSLTELRWPYAWSAWWTRRSLRFVTAFGYVFFTEGRLGDAPGIQYSHWHIIDGGRRLLFCANFDGTFGGYLDDFIKGASTGTTLFWRWTQLLPRPAAAAGHPAIFKSRAFAPTRLLVFRGVTCELKFKAYARESMLPHLYRFVANNFTLEEKNRATALRDALSGERTDAKDDLIMRTIES